MDSLPTGTAGQRWWNVGLLLSAVFCVVYAVGTLYAAQAPTPRTPLDGPVRMQPAGPQFVTTSSMFALQPRTETPGPVLLAPALQLQPGPYGARLAGAGPFAAGPAASPGFAVRLPLLVAAGVFAFLCLGQFARMALASWRGDLFAPHHGEDLRRLAWLALTIGLAHVLSVALQQVVGPRGSGTTIMETVVASAAVLASLFLFLFAHAVSEGAKIADDQFHTV